jgi:hypothetical protein
MHDGTKVKACAGDDTFRSEDRIRARLETAREQLLLAADMDDAMGLRITKARQRAAEEKVKRLEAGA